MIHSHMFIAVCMRVYISLYGCLILIHINTWGMRNGSDEILGGVTVAGRVSRVAQSRDR